MSDQVNSRMARHQQTNSRKKKNGKEPKSIKKQIKRVFLLLILIGFAGLLSGIGLFAYYASTAPELDEKLLKDPLTSEFLDRDGNVIMKFGAEKREFVPYEDIPKQMENAILATEDVRFYSHHGMDFWRLGGAIIANVRGGFGSQGASTITQQVIKNSFLSDEKTLKRKAQEAWLAFKLEREYSKEEIFEMYFNKILMSGNRYGFGTGADYFYGKSLNELELHEMAMLAGLPQYPNGYNPFKNPERAEKRRNIVLDLMYKHEKITKEEMDAAKAIPVTATILPEDKRQVDSNSKYPAYVDIVLDELEAAGMMDILSEGVKVQTNLDVKAQQAVEEALTHDELFESEDMQAGITVLDTKTGAIVAIGGGRNYSGRDLNFASDQKRQPGSVIKPILSYGPIIEFESWSTGQTIVDEPYNYKGTNKPIRNVDGKYHGKITIREALARSRNIPAVKVFEQVGAQKASSFANNLGLDYKDMNSSNAIGGGAYDFSTLQIAGAYSAFGNGGIYTKPYAIKKIIFRDGTTEKNMIPSPIQAMKDSTAYMTTDILRDVLTAGTGKNAQISGLDVAGKTGTTNYPSEIIKKHNFKNTDVPDTWFAGYTTNYTIAVWGGYKDYTSPIRTTKKGRHVPQHLFRMVMRDISSGKDTARFARPNSVEEATIEYGSNPLVLASATTPENMKRTELFVRGTVPVEMAEEEVIELEAPSNLSAQYNAETNSISLTWSHQAPDLEQVEGEVQFAVAVSVDGGELKEITKTNEFSAIFTGVEAGKTYTFSVVAVFNELTSPATTTSLRIDKREEEQPDDEQQTPIDDEDNDNGDDDQQQENDKKETGGNSSTTPKPNGNGNNPSKDGTKQEDEEPGTVTPNSTNDHNGDTTP